MLVIEIFPRGFSLQNYKLFLLIFQTSFPSRGRLGDCREPVAWWSLGSSESAGFAIGCEKEIAPPS
jgi:hypothetical protein